MPKIQKDNSEKDEKDEEQLIPEFKVGEKGEHEPFIHQGRTSPPKPYTEATLLRAMETAGRQVEDEELRELLKNNGIGRPSTELISLKRFSNENTSKKKEKSNCYANWN
jgi:DNA topoisomerase-3